MLLMALLGLFMLFFVAAVSLLLVKQGLGGHFFWPKGRRGRISFFLSYVLPWVASSFAYMMVESSFRVNGTVIFEKPLFLFLSALVGICYVRMTVVAAERMLDIGVSGWWAVALIGVRVLSVAFDSYGILFDLFCLLSLALMVLPGKKTMKKEGNL